MKSLFDNPDSLALIDKYYSLLMEEADRGCILLGLSIIDEQFDILFKRIMPPNTSQTITKKLFDAKGAFDCLGSKIDIAYVSNVLPLHLYKALHKLKGLRNHLAHRISPFSIQDKLGDIYEIFSLLNEAAPTGLLQMSGKVIYDEYLNRVMQLEDPHNDGEKLFSTIEEAIDYLHNQPDILSSLREQRVKALFIMGVITISALIIFHRERYIAKIAR